jgi:hypothetical protein
VSFPPFIGNEKDPLYLFHDSAFHAECFRQHALAESALILLQEMETKTAPSNRRCAVCEQPLNDPDDYFSLAHLVSDRIHPLYLYNYGQFHLTCLSQWPERKRLISLLSALEASGQWKGKSLKWLLDRLLAVGLEGAYKEKGEETGKSVREIGEGNR